MTRTRQQQEKPCKQTTALGRYDEFVRAHNGLRPRRMKSSSEETSVGFNFIRSAKAIKDFTFQASNADAKGFATFNDVEKLCEAAFGRLPTGHEGGSGQLFHARHRVQFCAVTSMILYTGGRPRDSVE